MKKIIVLGAGGLVGLNLLTAIDNSKYKIIAIDKKKENLELAKRINPFIEIIAKDLSYPLKDIEDLFKNAFCVIQLQAQISSVHKKDYINNNIKSIKNVTSICEKYGVNNLIHLSSSVIMSVSKDDYSITKTIGENIIKNSKCNYTILRPPLMYGCFDIKHLDFIIKYLDNKIIFPIPGSGKYIRQPLYVMDLVSIILKLIEKKTENKIYNIIGKEKLYFINLLRIIRMEKRKKTLFVKIPLPIFMIIFNVYNVLKNKKTYVRSQLTSLTAGDIFPASDWEKEFNLDYTPFKEGVKEMLNSKYYDYTKFMKK